MTTRCHWENDAEIGRWFLPGCMGGSVYGPRGCTCGSRRKPRATEDDEDDGPTTDERLDALERKLDEILTLLKGPKS